MGDTVQPESLAAVLLSLYPRAVREVYGYLVSRCGDPNLAEDITAETFMVAVDAVKAESVETLTAGWLIVVARRRLVDHWRRQEREQRRLHALADERIDPDDPLDERLDITGAREVLQGLAPQYRSALTLRYIDDLPVADVADCLGRGLHSTEGLLQRSRAAFRRAYEERGFHV